jgi:DNA-binding Lrp family transcriptional regulator
LIYRLVKSGLAKRILFLVDRRALAAQAVATMASFEAEPGLKFDQIYEVYSQKIRREDVKCDIIFLLRLGEVDMITLVPIESIVSKIVFLRSEKVLLDRDVAEMYGVETKHLKRAVRRNILRFPSDFMFQLTREEYKSLRRHFGTFKRRQVGQENPPIKLRTNFDIYLKDQFKEAGFSERFSESKHNPTVQS